MTVKSKASIKSFFETLDKPTAAQFIDFIDSYQDQDDTLDALVSVIQSGTAGVLEILGTGQTSLISASAGLAVLKSDQPASARGELGSGTVGDLMFLVETTAAGRDLLQITDTSAVVTAQADMFGIVELASQAEMEAASITDARAVTPGRMQNHPGVAKVLCQWEQVGAHSITSSHNMTSVTDGGATGDTDHLFNTDFSSANYTGLVFSGTANRGATLVGGTDAVGGLTSVTRQLDTNAAADVSLNYMAVFGDQ
ncbi:MAG: hypothetical protein J3T61_00175 [Candidatus Brocadiales bacterium]|nr:hypothetical protein [Candidatus Bathyanammoxibius sp.]